MPYEKATANPNLSGWADGAEILGITGKSRADYAPVLEHMLVAQITETQYTEEYYLEENREQTVEQGEVSL